jgi:hypothetical protein
MRLGGIRPPARRAERDLVLRQFGPRNVQRHPPRMPFFVPDLNFRVADYSLEMCQALAAALHERIRYSQRAPGIDMFLHSER